jgi:hypothetical protein
MAYAGRGPRPPAWTAKVAENKKNASAKSGSTKQYEAVQHNTCPACFVYRAFASLKHRNQEFAALWHFGLGQACTSLKQASRRPPNKPGGSFEHRLPSQVYPAILRHGQTGLTEGECPGRKHFHSFSLGRRSSRSPPDGSEAHLGAHDPKGIGRGRPGQETPAGGQDPTGFPLFFNSPCKSRMFS